jgi:hypothetical protein
MASLTLLTIVCAHETYRVYRRHRAFAAVMKLGRVWLFLEHSRGRVIAGTPRDAELRDAQNIILAARAFALSELERYL